ncbi:MAG: hypothetical protein ABJP89_19575 [Lentilitoribacter sp.]
MRLLFQIIAALVILPVAASAQELSRYWNTDNTCSAYDDWQGAEDILFIWTGECSSSNLANGHGIAIFLSESTHFAFVYTGEMDRGYMSGLSRVEWVTKLGQIDHSPQSNFFTLGFSNGGLAGTANFEGGKLNGEAYFITNDYLIIRRLYEDNTAIQQDEMEVWDDVFSYVKVLNDISDLDTHLGHDNCSSAEHLFRASGALRRIYPDIYNPSNVYSLSSLPIRQSQLAGELYECARWGDLTNQNSFLSISYLSELRLNEVDGARRALYAIEHQTCSQHDHEIPLTACQNRISDIEEMEIHSSTLGIDYASIFQFPLSHIMSAHEDDFIQYVVRLVGDRKEDPLGYAAGRWVDLLTDVVEGAITGSSEGILKKAAPDILISWGTHLDPNHPTYGLLEAIGDSFRLDQHLEQ